MDFTAIKVRVPRKWILQEGLWSGLSVYFFPLGINRDSWKPQPIATLSPFLIQGDGKAVGSQLLEPENQLFLP